MTATPPPHGRPYSWVGHDFVDDCKKLYVCVPSHPMDHKKETWFAVGFKWAKVPEGEMPSEHGAGPLLTESRYQQIDGLSMIQAIVDAAWDAGIKPRSYKAEETQLSAVKYHLEDMRKLVLKDRAK